MKAACWEGKGKDCYNEWGMELKGREVGRRGKRKGGGEIGRDEGRRDG